MDGNRLHGTPLRRSGRPGPLTDSALDRELEAALNVEPSPEFLARVRMHLATEPAPAASGIRWVWLTAAGAAAVVILIAALWPSAEPAGGPRRATPAPVIAENAPRPATRTVPEPTKVIPRGERRVADAAPRPSEAGESQPYILPLSEVLISADEVRAYEMLFARVRPLEASVEASAPRAAPVERAEVLQLDEVPVMQLAVEPLPQLARLQIGE